MLSIKKIDRHLEYLLESSETHMSLVSTDKGVLFSTSRKNDGHLVETKDIDKLIDLLKEFKDKLQEFNHEY